MFQARRTEALGGSVAGWNSSIASWDSAGAVCCGTRRMLPSLVANRAGVRPADSEEVCPVCMWPPLAAGRSGMLQNLTHSTHGGLKGCVGYTPADHRQAREIARVREFTLMVQLPFSAVIWPGGMVVAKGLASGGGGFFRAARRLPFPVPQKERLKTPGSREQLASHEHGDDQSG